MLANIHIGSGVAVPIYLAVPARNYPRLLQPKTLVVFLFVMVVLVTALVVFVERGQRKITVNYAKRQVGNKVMGGQSTHLPLKLNMAGVIPPIFASSIILFPASLAGWFGSSESMYWLKDLSGAVSPGQPIYIFLFASAILFFCFFYTILCVV